MVTLLIGKKGSGKTKKLVSLANEAVVTSTGTVAVIERGSKLTFDVTHKARLIDTEQYDVQGYDGLYGFICGICAGNYDISNIFVDSTFRICGKDFAKLCEFVNKLNTLANKSETKITLLISADESELPDDLKSYCKKP